MEMDKVITEKEEEPVAGTSHSDPNQQTTTTGENVQSTDLKEIEMQPYRSTDKKSSSESSSDSSSTSSDSSDSSEKKKKLERRPRKPRRQKGEYDDLPPIEDIDISMPEVLCDPVGKVGWMVQQIVVVKPNPEKPTLDLDTILFVDKGKKALGRIFDVFGAVNEPHYCVRFNSPEHIQQRGITVGMTVYYCPNTEHTSLVSLIKLLQIKGVDESPEGSPVFSDDEEEMAYYGIVRPTIEVLEEADDTNDTNDDTNGDEEPPPKTESEEE